MLSALLQCTAPPVLPVPTLTLPASRSLSVSGAAGSSRPDTDFACVPLAFSVRPRRALPSRHAPGTACSRKLTLEKRPALRYNSFCKCRCGSMAEHKLPKLVTRVRFPSSALFFCSFLPRAGRSPVKEAARSRGFLSQREKALLLKRQVRRQTFVLFPGRIALQSEKLLCYNMVSDSARYGGVSWQKHSIMRTASPYWRDLRRSASVPACISAAWAPGD